MIALWTRNVKKKLKRKLNFSWYYEINFPLVQEVWLILLKLKSNIYVAVVKQNVTQK